MVRTNHKESGFTLVELMVVLVILSIGLLPLALIQTRAQRDVLRSGQFSEAIRVAELQMESAKALGFGNIPPDSGTVDGLYTWRRNIVNLSNSMDEIDLSVDWNEGGKARSLAVTNRISSR